MRRRRAARDRAGRGGRRSVATAVVLALVASLAPATVATAQTGPGYPPFGDVNLLFSEPSGRYGANRLVRIEAGNINFVRACPEEWGGFVDWFQPAADLYIVPSGGTIHEGTALTGSRRTVFGGLAGQFFDAPLLMTAPAGPLGSGTYDVVVDECQDGRFDQGVDSVVRDAFVVNAEELVPGFAFEAAEFQRLKQIAKGTATGMLELRKSIAMAEGWEATKKIASIATASTSLTGMLGFAVGELISAYDPLSALQARGKEVATTSLQQRMAAAYNLAKDPPDPNFQVHAVPERETGAIPSDYAVDALDDLFRGVTGLDQLGAIEAAFLTALERYQGAQLAGNPVWALRHARTLQRLATLHAQLASVVADDLHDALDRYRADTTSYTYTSALHLAFGSLTTNHPTSQVRFWNSGADLDETQEAIGVFLDLVDGAQATTHLAGTNGYAVRGQAAAAMIEELSEAMNAWADAALDDLVDELEDYLGARDADPTAVITVVDDAPVGGTITLDAGASTPAPGGPAIDGYAWDLSGDGEFDDATGPTPTWEVPGDAVAGAPWLIGLRVTAGDGVDVVHLPVVLVEGNRRPVLELVDPGPREADAGDTVRFEVASVSDPDGDPVTLTWVIDDEVLEGVTGTTYDLELADDTFDTFRVEVIASDPSGARVIDRWGLDVRNQVDADRDGYYAWPGPDCDDDDQFVNPGRPEILNNGKDDDCNPDTPDEGDGRTGHPSLLTGGHFQGVAGDVHTVSVSGWSHAQRYLEVPFTMTVDWPDGTRSEQTVQGTTYNDTVFELSHQYTAPVRNGQVSYCIRYEAGLVGCNQGNASSVHVVGSPPMVGAADHRTWPVDREAESGNCYWACDLHATWSPADPDGRVLLSTGNPNERLVAHSPIELSEDGYGRAMVQLSTDQPGGDDDVMGFVLGYQSNEIGDGAVGSPDTRLGTADFVAFEWASSGRARVTNTAQCSNGGFTAEDDVWSEMAVVLRQRGLPLWDERMAGRIFDFPPAEGQDPRCHDDEGIERLQVIEFPQGARVTQDRQRWISRGMREGVHRPAPNGPLADPYHFTVDYRPDRLQIWMDGDLVADVAPSDPADPFPPGAFGVMSGSNPSTRAQATIPEPEFAFQQGTPGPIVMPMSDGDGADDTHTAIIDWGDGSPQSVGTVTPDPDTGLGWFEVTDTHTYHRVGTHRGEVCVTDAGDASSCFTFRAVVDNFPPVVDAGPSPEGRPGYLAGGTLTLDQATFDDPGLFDTHTATIDWGDGTVTDGEVVQRGGGGTVSGTHDYAEDDTYTIEVCVTDQDGLTGCDTVEAEIRATNVAPVALLEVADAVAGQPVRLGVGFTDQNPNDTHTATLDPGDDSGAAPVTGLRGLGGYGQGTVVHTYDTPGTYTVEACVTDQHGATDCADDELTVTAAPDAVTVALVPIDGTPDEGDEVTIAGTFEVDDDAPRGLVAAARAVMAAATGATVTATIDPGDGSPPLTATVDPDAGTFSAAHVFRDDGVFTVLATVCEADDRCGTDQLEVTVANVAPTVVAGRDRTTDGLVVLDDTTFTDPGVDDTHTATVDWDDGDDPVEATVTWSSGTGTVQATHHYEMTGVRQVEVCVADDGAASGCDRFQVTVVATAEDPITVEVDDPDPLDEGGTIELTFRFDDAAPDGDAEVATIRWGDGSEPQTVELTIDDASGDGGSEEGVSGTGTATHRYLDDGTYGVSVEVCDGERCGLASTSVVVRNVAPTVAPPTGEVTEGRLAITAAFTDPGELDIHTARVDWGDGTTSAAVVRDGEVAASHDYGASGSYDVEVCVTDDDGDTGCTTASFTVTVVEPDTSACPPDRVPPAGFRDTRGNTHEAAIDCAAWYGLARGRDATRYDPAVVTTREQMASFLVRLLRLAGAELPAPRPTRFDDLTGGPHDAAIGQLHAIGIVRGRTVDRFAPTEPVRRDQMAAFLVRTYEHLAGELPVGPTGFADLAGNVHRTDIRKAETAGFALGRSETRFAPASGTRRDQMASFLIRILESLAADGRVVPPDRR